jgi:hypothetical protein
MFTFICKAKGQVVGLWSLNSVKVSLNFPIYTVIIKRAKKIICQYKLEQMNLKALPYKPTNF